MSALSGRFVRLAAAAVLAGAVGCVYGRTTARPVPSRDWPQTLAQAEVAAADHRYADADKLLADYATLYPGTDGAIESAYWRGVFALDPNNRDTSPQDAAALLDVYANANGALPHRLEAQILRRIALRLMGAAGTTLATASPATTAASSGSTDRSADLKAKDNEIQRLKDELAKANDELERIKRRLTAPTKP